MTHSPLNAAWHRAGWLSLSLVPQTSSGIWLWLCLSGVAVVIWWLSRAIRPDLCTPSYIQKTAFFCVFFFFLCTFCGQKSGWHKEGTPLWSSMCLCHLYARTRKEDVYILMQVFWEDFFQWKCLISKGFKDTKTNQDDKQRHSWGDNRKYIVAQLRMTRTDDNNRTQCCKVVEIN